MENQIDEHSKLLQKSKQTSRHLEVKCKVCWKKMRSDKLKRHNLVHEKNNTKEEEVNSHYSYLSNCNNNFIQSNPVKRKYAAR